jgi:CheY-like chemotaxis protein
MPDNKRGKVVIADNDEEILLALERLLEDEGYETAVASNRNDLTTLSPEQIDLLVLDDYLSDADCIEVLTQLQPRRLKRPTIVTYHRMPSDQMRRQLGALGVDAVICKASHAQLVTAVRHLMEGVRPDPFEYIT